MLIVAYLYNNNGMASWCWEAAHALAEAGKDVLLVCSKAVAIPADGSVNILRFDPEPSPRETLWQKMKSEINWLSSKSSGFVGQLHRHLEEHGIVPSTYFLNQSDLQDPGVAVPQYVVGWAYPTSLLGYIAKIGRLTRWKASRKLMRTILMCYGWWRKDWRSYHSATGVLAVSQRIAKDLSKKKVNVRVIQPGTLVCDRRPCFVQEGVCRLLVTALDLEEPRKRVRWMVKALKSAPQKQFHLTLVGHASEAFQDWVCTDDFPATFTGCLRRDEVRTLMANQDAFLLGSALDDWGYVLTEAMSQGLAVVAPNIGPFDEIVGDAGQLYELTSQKDFRKKVVALTSSDILSQRQAAWARADALFSRRIFAQNLLSVMERQESSEAHG